MVVGSWRVKSGETAVQLWPSSLDLKSTFAPMYSVLGSCRDASSGAVHWKR